ncbi:MAG: nuclear transport factor 2 family protein [Phormidesmis sp.]
MTRMLDTANSQPNEPSDDLSDGLVLPVPIQSYFDALNQKDFFQAAALFSQQGQLIPPFEKPIEGREAIAHYLATEASEMTLMPISYKPQNGPENADLQSFKVEGKVKHTLFVVNVAWQFDITTNNKIESVQIKLLASLQELLKVKR